MAPLRPWLEVAAVLASGFVPGMPSPLVAMLAVASVLRWIAGTSWGDAGLGGANVFRDLALGTVAGASAFVIVFLIAGVGASGELAVVRGSGQALVAIAILTIAFSAAAEMVFRGFVMSRIAKATGSWALGNIAAAIAFGFAIGGRDLGAVLGVSVAGIGYGLLYMASGRRLALPIAAHVAFALGAVIAAALRV